MYMYSYDGLPYYCGRVVDGNVVLLLHHQSTIGDVHCMYRLLGAQLLNDLEHSSRFSRVS